MKLGISTAALYPLETEKALEFLGQNGVPVTEIFFNSHCELEEEFIELLNGIRLKYNIEINSLHACGSVGEPYYLFSEYERRYSETRKFYEKYYRAAKTLGAKMLVLHGDSLHGHISFAKYAERLKEMNEDARQYGVWVVHENVNRFRLATPENVRMMRKLCGDVLKFTFDIKQAVRAGVDPYKMLDAMSGGIVNVHISDNKDGADCLLPGQGNFDFEKFFKTLRQMNYNGACLIEVYRNCYGKPDELIDAYKNVKQFPFLC